jgi:hypothetical protein
LLLLPVWILAGMPQPLTANPLPEAILLIHTQPVDPDFCANPIRTCDEIVPFTEATGLVEFDLFFMPAGLNPPVEMNTFEAVVQWTGAGAIVDWQICNIGGGTVQAMGNEASLDLYWPFCPVVEDEIFLIARIVVDVGGYGQFRVSEGAPCRIGVGCPVPEYIEPWPLPATAGVVCSYCFMPCTFQSPCRPSPDPEFLYLDLRQGEIVQRDIHVDVHGGGGVWPCPTGFDTTEPWMTVGAIELAMNEWLATLEIDTSALDPGHYQGWMRAAADCVGCTRVELDVRPPNTGVSEDPSSTTWGRVKTLYR